MTKHPVLNVQRKWRLAKDALATTTGVAQSGAMSTVYAAKSRQRRRRNHASPLNALIGRRLVADLERTRMKSEPTLYWGQWTDLTWTWNLMSPSERHPPLIEF